MATTNYSYKNYESLGDISEKFSTSVLNLVKLNKWLKDPNDGHTYMYPSQSPRYIKPIYDNGDIIGYETSDSQDDRLSYTEYRLLEMVVPLIGNGNVSIEDYWDNVNQITGISYNTLVDNIINDTNILSTNYNSETNNNILGETTAILPGKDNFISNSTTYGVMNSTTNSYMNDFLGRYENSAQLVDYADGLVGNYLQSQLNAGAKNLSVYSASGLYRPLGSTYFQKYNSKETKTYNNTGHRVRYTGRQNYSSSRYSTIGNPNIIKGQCIVIIDGVTLYMPCYPDSISDSTAVSYTSQNALGRSEPYQAYENSGPRSIPFTFRMHREMTGDISEIERIVRFIESAVYPNYDGTVSAVKTTVQIGNSIYISGIMTNQSTNWSGPIGPDNKYNVVDLSFTVTEVTGDPKSSGTIRKIGGFRS